MGGVQRNADVVSDVVEGRAVLVDPSGRELITLNPVGTIVWEAMDGEHDASELTAAVAARFPAVPRAVIESDVAAFLGELTRLGLVTPAASD